MAEQSQREWLEENVKNSKRGGIKAAQESSREGNESDLLVMEIKYKCPLISN